MPEGLERDEGEELQPLGGFEAPADLPELGLAGSGKLEFVTAGEMAGPGDDARAIAIARQAVEVRWDRNGSTASPLRGSSMWSSCPATT